MSISDFLFRTWRPALGCTEPASIAYAASLASTQATGEIKAVYLRCDPRMFKNCFAVGIPNSDGKTGILWAAAIGATLPDPSRELECFDETTPALLKDAALLIASDAIFVETVFGQGVLADTLYVDCRVVKTGGSGRAILEGGHTRVVLMEKDGMARAPHAQAESVADRPSVDLKDYTLAQMIEASGALSAADRSVLRYGCELNLAICRHGATHFDDQVLSRGYVDATSKIARTVFFGVHARMSGAAMTVMSAAGSGNKGITCSVPLALYGEELHADQKEIDEALALTLILNALATEHLGTLSAICGCTNAAGIGLAAGLVLLQGGGCEQVSHAITNMVGNITGIICDGAKIGCALKAMTAVEAAFRAAALALDGICIPVSDGIVGKSGSQSLDHLGRIATRGMAGMDNEILQIMKDKLHSREVGLTRVGTALHPDKT
jgi:L-cysteine desulfidase